MSAPGSTGLDYPAFFESAGETSLKGQHQYMALTAIRSTALVIAALGGAASFTLGSVEVFAWVALSAFVVALATEVVVYALAPDQLWYEGRAAAESIKTLSWRYAVGGDPFPVSLSLDEARRQFISQLSSVANDLAHIPPPRGQTTDQITASMEIQRCRSFENRKSVYLQGRIVDQIDWYSAKARTNEHNRQIFILFTILFEFIGIIAAALRVAQVVDFDLLGIVAALVASIATWAQTRQYGQLARSYSIAAHELMSIKSEIANKLEDDWSRFVDESEEAISREHTLWRASRGVLRQRRTG